MDNPNTINVDSPVVNPTIMVDSPTPVTSPPITPEQAQDRSDAASFGLSKFTGITPIDFSNAINNGKENDIRAEAANKVDGIRQQMAKDIIGKQWYDLDPTTLQTLLKAQDPNSVVEEHYANSYYQHIFWPRDPDTKSNDTFMYQMGAFVPEQLDAMGRFSQDMIAKNEILRTTAQNSEASNRWYNRGSFLLQGAQDLATFGAYSEIAMRTGVADTGLISGGLGLGSNLDEQRRNLFNLPIDQFKETLNKTIASLPRDLQTPWLSAMLDRSMDQTAQYNFFTGLLGLGAVKSGVSFARDSVPAISRVSKAFSDITVARDSRIPPAVSAPAQAGNPVQAGINRVAIDKTNELLNPGTDPFKEWSARASGFYDLDGRMAADNPGSLGREVGNRIADMYDSMRKDMLEVVETAERVDPNPTSGMQDRLQAIWDHLVGKFNSSDNKVLNVSRGEIVAGYVPGLNVRMFNIPMGDADGNIFKNIEQAKASAKKDGWVVKGDYDVKPEELVKVRRIEVAIKGWRIQATLANTPEGAARANGIADRAQAKLNKLPRHTTGVTIEEYKPFVASNKESFEDTIKRLDTDIGPVDKSKNAGQRWGSHTERDLMGEEDIPVNPFVKAEWEAMGRKVPGPGEEWPTPKTRLQLMAEKYGSPESPIIKQQGNGFYINHVVYLPEQANFVRDGILTSKIGEMSVADYRDAVVNNKVSTGLPPSWFNGWASALLGRVIGPAETLSAAEQMNRVVATHGPSVFLGLTKKGLIPIEEIPIRYQQDFNRLLQAAQSEWNEATKSPGIWYDHPAQIEDFYQRNFKRSPVEQEVKAYFAYKALALNDLLFRELAVMRKKIVMDVKQHAIRYTDKNGVNTATNFFEGVARTEFPKEGRVLLVNSADTSKSKYRWASNVEKYQPGVLEDIRQGRAQLIHIVDPSCKPLKDILNGSPDFVVAYKVDQKPIGFHHVNRTGAGHLVPEGQYYLKSANIDIADFGEDGVHRYYNGDNTMFNFHTRYEAEAAQPHLEEVRKLFAKFSESPEFKEADAIQRWENEGGLTGANSYLDQAADYAKDTGLPFSKLMEWYFGDGKNKPPRLDVNEPIHVVKAGQKINQLDNSVTHFLERHPNLHDNTRSGTLLSQVMQEFTQERDMEGLYTLKDIGTEQAPLFKYQPAEFVDPITSLNRGLNRIVNSMYMNDMKQFSMEHWLEQAKDTLEIQSPNDFRNNPLQWFHNPVYKKGIPERIRGQLETARLQALDFIGTPSVFETGFREMTQGLADSIYGKYKVKVPFLYDLPRISNVTAFLRGTAFAASQIGLKQFFTQASSMFNIVGIAGPRYATKGTAAATMYAYWRMFSGRPEILAGMDKKLAQHFGWKLGEFENAVGLIERSGFGHVGAEHAVASNATTLGLESMKSVSPFTIGLQTARAYGRTMLKWGTTPFEMGTAVTRRAAFFTSYLEHLDREVGAGGSLILDRQTSGAILRRASLLDSNMSRAFSSALHTGAMSIPMQFEAYEIRMAEMMYGKNLTRAEKMGLFASNSAMYGLRGGYFALLGLPLTDYAVRKMQESGYVPGENGLLDLIVNGFPSWAFAYLSGFTDPQGKKTWNDFSQWGNKGIQAMDKFFDEDQTLASIMSGVLGNVFVSAWQGSQGTRRDMWSIVTGDGRFQLNGDDVLQMFKALSVVNDLDQVRLAFNTGKWFTRNGTYVTDMSQVQAIVKLITGVSPLKGKDVWEKQQSIKAIDDELKVYQREATLEMQRAYRDRQNGYEAGFDEHWRRAGAIIQTNVPTHKWGEVVRAAIQNAGISLDERLDKKLLDLTNDFDLYIKRKGQQ